MIRLFLRKLTSSAFKHQVLKEKIPALLKLALVSMCNPIIYLSDTISRTFMS